MTEITEINTAINITDVHGLPDMVENDPKEGLDLFDVILRHDTNFDLDQDHNADPEFRCFSVLCNSYVKSSKLLVTTNFETADYYLSTLPGKMSSPLYARILHYNTTGSIISEEILKIAFVYMGVVARADTNVMIKAFIFNIEH